MAKSCSRWRVVEVFLRVSCSLAMFRLILPRVRAQVCEVIKVQSRGFSDPVVIVFSCLLCLSLFLNFKITPCAHTSTHEHMLSLVLNVHDNMYISIHFRSNSKNYPTFKHSRGMSWYWICMGVLMHVCMFMLMYLHVFLHS